MNAKPPQQRITVDLGEKEAEGIYANLALISNSPAEFILDFSSLDMQSENMEEIDKTDLIC